MGISPSDGSLRSCYRKCLSGRGPQGRHWRDYISQLVWEHIWDFSAGQEEVSVENEVWAYLLGLTFSGTLLGIFKVMLTVELSKLSHLKLLGL